MNTEMSSKFEALAIALMINSLIFGGVNYLFNGQLHQRTARVSLAQIDCRRTAADRAGVTIVNADRCPRKLL
jgi:hypothetical protein